MSRVDNHVVIIGTVVKGPIYRTTKEGKGRTFYQVQIPDRAKDKGNIQVPFVRSVGNQAEKDRDNIKTGDMVIVEGRLITRNEIKKMFFIKDEADPQKLIQYDPEDEEGPIYDDDQIFEAEVKRSVTDVMADDVFYFHKFVDLLEDKEKLKLFSPKVLKLVLETYFADKQEIVNNLLDETKG